MRKQIEGSQAIAAAVQCCRPEVISCYPITPQTHIVETLSAKVKSGELENCEFINVESEFAALSVLIGASAAGARTYTATASQGLLYMAEAVYNASGMGFPIVMTIGNRAIGAPINIWNDHSDSMSMRDAGWVQLYAESNQEAVDLHIQAFRLAESLSLPVMVCVDGFVLTHAFEPVEIPSQAQVDSFLPSFDPVQVLDPENPISMGTMVGPNAFFEVRYLHHEKHLRALERIPTIAREFEKTFGRKAAGLAEGYFHEDAETIFVALGSMNGTIKDFVDLRRARGEKVGCIKLVSYRPFPSEVVRSLADSAQRVICVEKHLAPGTCGVVASEVRHALQHSGKQVQAVIGGIGGRPISLAALDGLWAERNRLDEPHFLGLNWEVIGSVLENQKKIRRSGPVAESVVKTVAEKGGFHGI
ncbi:MAG: hypothetical protein KDD51_02535 [Bdellovibrionales bacterium]|nr:hypothetical protein [Bdellovibrionales bacterium]